jgi:hypothetical protein
MNGVGDGLQQRVRAVSVDRATVSPAGEMPTPPPDGQAPRLARQAARDSISCTALGLAGDIEDRARPN